MKRLKELLKDRLIVNFLHLFGGDAFASLFSILSISFITKGIGLEKYGFIVLIQGIVALIDGVFNFQSWQGFIKFFPEVRESREKLKSLIKFSYCLDMFTALLAFSITLLLTSWIGDFYSFVSEERGLFLLFSIYIIFNIQGTPIGILRSFNRFDYLRNQRVVVALFNFILLLLGYIAKFKIGYFIIAYLLTNILSGGLLNYFAMKELKTREITRVFSGKLEFNKEFFHFTCLTNINSSLDIPVQYFDNLLIGKMLSLEQLGVYKICKTIAIILDKVGAPIYQTLYPYFCEKVIEKKYSEIVKRAFNLIVVLSIFCFGVIFSINLIGFEILSKFFTQNMLNYKLEINLYLVIKSLATVFIVIHPLFLAMGYIKKETKIIFIANIIYLGVLLIFIKRYALIGVILAYGVQVTLIVLMKLLVVLKRE